MANKRFVILGIVAFVLACLLCIGVAEVMNGGASTKGEPYLMGQLDIRPLWLARMDGGTLVKASDGVLILRIGNQSGRPRTIVLARTNPLFLAKASFSDDQKSPPIEFSPLEIEWYDQLELIHRQNVALPTVKLEPNGFADIVVGITTPGKQGSFDVHLALDNESVAFAPSRNLFRNDAWLEWTGTLKNVAVDAEPVPLVYGGVDAKRIQAGFTTGPVMTGTETQMLY